MALDVDAARAAVQTIADAMGSQPRRRRRGHPGDRQREHGRRAARDQRPARPRPARVRARRVRRRRPAARQRRRRADGLVPGDRAAVARAAVRARRPRGRLPQRVRAHADPARRARRRPTRSAPSSTSSRAARASGWTREGIAAERQGVDVRRRHALPRPGLRDPGADWSAATSRRSRSASTRLHEQLYGFRMPDTPSEIVNLRAVGDRRPARRPSCPRATRLARGREPGRADGPIYDRAALQPGNRIAGPAIVTEFDSTTVVLAGYEAEVDRYFNILIRPEGAVMSATRAADRRDPRHRDRPDHARHHRERAAPRALRDGRRAVPQRDEPGDPRAARRVPDDHRPAGPHGRRPVRRLHLADDGASGTAASTRAT